jgi:pyruvate-formate lyase-activating enzyme
VIKYYNKITWSISEINSSATMLVHALSGCNLHCAGCFNYDLLVASKHDAFFTMKDVCKAVSSMAELAEYVVISGGEYLLSPIEELVYDLTLLRETTTLPIIVYTNGTNPEKLQYLFENNLISGAHTDLKLPFYELEQFTDADIIYDTVGKKLTSEEIDNIRTSIISTVQYDMGLNQIRSVKYPWIDSSVFEENSQYISTLNKRFNKNTPYIVNNFIVPQ